MTKERGVPVIEASTGRADLGAGTPTAIGSLPHTEPDEAVAFVLSQLPELPAAPQLPARTKREGMVAQWAVGIPGVTIGPDGKLRVQVSALDPEEPIDPEIRRIESAGLLAFLDAAKGRREPVKLQLTGPLTLGMALSEAFAPPAVAFAVARRAIQAKARRLVELAAARAPGTPLVVFVDEPVLATSGHPGFPLASDEAIDLLSGALAALGPATTTGVHCCGVIGWRLAMQAGARVLSLPAAHALADDAEILAGFLDDGGWIAWGVVPTTGPVGNDVDVLWRHLNELWNLLVQAGCDPARLRQQSLVTPACGLANHGLTQAERVLALVRGVAERIQDQASAARITMGA